MRFLDETPITPPYVAALERWQTVGYAKLLWPRALALAALRAAVTPYRFGAAHYTQTVAVDAATEEELLADCVERGDFTAAAAHSLLETLFGQERNDPATLPVHLCLLEAFVGPETMLESIVSLIERVVARGTLPPHSAGAQCFASHVGYTLLRVPIGRAQAARERLQRAARALEAMPGALWQQLDVTLYGAEGAARSGHRSNGRLAFQSLAHVHDREFVAHAALEALPPSGYVVPDARLVFLGGHRVYRGMLDWFAKFKGGGVEHVWFETFGVIDAPETYELMVRLSNKAATKQAALQWLQSHEVGARAYLARDDHGPLTRAANNLRNKLLF